MAKTAFITGITGQDGSYLAELLLTKGYTVYGLVRRLSTPNIKNIEHILGKIAILDGDLADHSSLISALSIAQPDEIYNLASQSFVQTSFKQPVYTADINGLGVVRLLDAMRITCPEARFYQASTSELFGNAKESPQNENTPFSPRSPYGFSKLLGYWATVNYRESYGFHASNGILFNHESPRRGLEFVTRKITDGVARIKFGLAKELVLGNLDARRDWGYAPEYVEAMWLMLQQKDPGDYVIATGKTHSVREFVELAFEYAGIDNWEKYVKVDRKYIRPAEIHVLCGDYSKARKKIGWKPKTKFKDLVKIMVESDIKRYKEAGQ
ncbi:MAG: GDP-mannose 4,6-dehydratase [Candidatus Thermoplasmatota archaeon]